MPNYWGDNVHLTRHFGLRYNAWAGAEFVENSPNAHSDLLYPARIIRPARMCSRFAGVTRQFFSRGMAIVCMYIVIGNTEIYTKSDTPSWEVTDEGWLSMNYCPDRLLLITQRLFQ